MPGDVNEISEGRCYALTYLELRYSGQNTEKYLETLVVGNSDDCENDDDFSLKYTANCVLRPKASWIMALPIRTTYEFYSKQNE